MKTAFRSLIGFIVYSGTFFVALLVCGLFWSIQEFSKPGPLAKEKVIEIPAGSSLAFIANQLEHEQIVSDALLFQTAVRVLGEAGNLRAGEYAFEPGISMSRTMEKMKKGRVFLRFFTIPEGLTSYEIVRLINAHPELQGEPITAIPPEGSLLPETYNHMRVDTKENAINYMKQGMEAIAAKYANAKPCSEATPKGEACIPAPLKNWSEVVTLASIVEKETGIAAERQRVAGVFLNRLRKGIPLQTDPTVIYAITNGKHQNEGKGPLGRRLLRKDLEETDSPYNTYKYPGLTPGPIANPGKASIEAVMNPEQHDFIYFVADGSGGHIFARTLDEHNKNAANWREIRRKKDAEEKSTAAAESASAASEAQAADPLKAAQEPAQP